jgi:hypothetical protein
MSHFAKVENGIVTEVVVATQEGINTEVFGDAFNWVQTSYNNSFRGKFASVGDTWDGANFVPEKPFDSWVFSDANYQWEAPVENLVSPNDQIMAWNEDTLAWDEVVEPT